MFPEFRRRIFTMAESYVTGETLVGEIVSQYPEAIEVLLSIGMHCLGCPASRAESLADACAVHGMPVDRVIEAINAKIAEAR
jgi:hybrid cluster-associated redox disulfide protein|uniref:Putative sulfite reductase assimilatory-type n=1 Tax=uncultured bacterium Contig1767 TaxID=1393509 RepID=W0FGP7_9BACT|nr:putative sulfite reductase assimilatory-type [uncultured bacterium Contig1767]